MKKILGFLVCSSLILSLAGCGSVDGNAGRTAGNAPGVNDVLEAGKNAVEQTEASEDNTVTESDVISEESVSEDDNTAVTESASADDEDPNTDPESSIHFDMTSVNMDKIDVDLTALSSTMVYSEVYNMMTTPDDYIGKVVKMDGAFAVFHDEGSSDYYFACIVKDATACCAQGIEFLLAGEHSYPKDYPYEGDEICVVGVYDTYKDGDSTYCTLKNAKIV
ncbi:MAG: hypothetical protein J5864_10220 [Oscillospiraceae bacterium]|nr:hypothetical protein [Oscillospiraceae bacterium]